MYKSVKAKDYADWEVIDLDTRKHIRGVQWANDETGDYELYVIGKWELEKRKGNIRLIKKTEIKC